MKKWSQEYSVNHPVMDADHQKLMEMLEYLYQSMKSGQNKISLEPLIKDLHSYALNHFSREEQYLRSISHPQLDSQKEQHQLFLNKVLEFKQNYETGKTMIAVHMLPFLNDWFSNHILKVDMHYK